MKSQTLRTLAVSATLASGMFAQNQRQATMVGGGSPDRGKCTIEVVNGRCCTSGNSWRNHHSPHTLGTAGAVAPMERDRAYPNSARGPVNPPVYGGNPPNYQDREQRGPGNAPAYGDSNRNRYGSEDQYRPNYRDSDYYRRYSHAFVMDEAVRICQQAVLAQAARRFHTNDIHFHRTAIDDSPGWDDWVTGTVDVHRGPREERFSFSCSVNFDTGRVRSATLDPRRLPDDPRWH